MKNERHIGPILTSNGGDPKHFFFYTGIVNASKTLDYVYGDEWCAKRGIKATPSQELRFFDSERKNDYMAYHMSLEDNPVYSGEGLKALYELYPIGSFMYYSRILWGCVVSVKITHLVLISMRVVMYR